MTFQHRLANEGGTAQRLSVFEYWFVNPDGTLHRRKSITAFTAPKRAATGRKDDVLRYFDWAAGLGYNEARCFTRVDWVGPPGSGVETGWQYDGDACAWVLQAGAQRGMHIELVANTGPFGNGAQDCADQVRRVDELCLAHENGLLEVWNEPQQNGGNDLVAEVLRRYMPRTPGWASGVYDQTPYPAGPSMTYHSPRKDEWPRCFKDAFEYSTGQGPNVQFSPSYHGPVMLDEPPQMEVTAVPVDWEAYGSGSALFAAGVLAHGNPSFQKCEIPTRTDVLACCEALIRGVNAVPLQIYFGYEHPSDQGSLRRYRRFGADGGVYEISVRPYEFKRVA